MGLPLDLPPDAVRRSNLGIGGGEGGGPPTPPTGAERESQLRLTGALLEAVGDEARANGTDVLVVEVPARGEIGPSAPAHYPADRGIPYYRAQREMLPETAAGHPNVSFLPLEPVFDRETDAGRRMYDREVANAHFVAEGYRRMARTIYGTIVAAGYPRPVAGLRRRLPVESEGAGR